jgi:hypothetical protein
MINGTYKVVGFNVTVKVTGNAGIHGIIHLAFGQLLWVENGNCIIGARILLSGEVEHLFLTRKVEKIF